MLADSSFQGTLVRLTPFRGADLPVIAAWYAETNVGRLADSTPSYPKSEGAIKHWLEESERDQNTFAFAIRSLHTDELLGYIDLSDVQWTHRVAWLGIAIGEPANRGQGYGTEAMRLLLRFAFNELNLHRIQLTVFSYNTSAVQLYERLGFKREGVYREALLRDGTRYHVYLYGLLRREWLENERER